MLNHYAAISLATILILHFEACVSTPSPRRVTSAGQSGTAATTGQPGTSTPPAQTRTSAPAAQELAKLKAKVMSADYRGDIEELARLRDEFSRWRNDRELVYLANYWSGFASWRMAINGTNQNMKADELTANLKNAASEFYSAIRLKDDFTDAYAAAALVNSWLAVFNNRSAAVPSAARANALDVERLSLSRALFTRATALDPENPRVLWAKGAFLLYTPESQGGSVARAIEVYRQMLKEADRRGVDPASPLPDWGRPEALMSIAYAHTRQTPPDLAAAREEAHAALRLEPEWSYVRDNLLPQIEQRLRAER